MTALRRITVRTLSGFAAMVSLGLGSAALAQSSDAPIDVTAAPPPSAETIGPSQLRDFNLQGTVTRSADSPAATPAQHATTAAAPPRTGEAVPSEAAASPVRHSPLTSSQSASNQQEPGSRISAGIAGRGPVTPSLPLEVTTDTAAQPIGESGPGLDAPSLDSDGGWSWPWIAALVALIGGGAFIAWSQRSRRQRYDDPGRLAFAGAAELAPLPTPRPDPVPSGGQPRPAPRPDPVPSTRPAPAPAPSNDGLIVSTRLKPKLNVEFHPERVVVTDDEVLLQFDVVLANVGSAPARDVLVEARMFTASISQDREIAAFFQNPMTEGDRMTSIAPLGRISLKSVARLPLDDLNRFEAAGRKMFVPLIGFNISYRSSGGEGQASASFLVGRGNEEDEKLAPFRLDQGPRSFKGLSARPHSIGLQGQAA
jgi:hypothetical protein